MDFPIDQVGSILEILEDNWSTILVIAGAAIASIDTFFMVVIKSMGNIRDTYRDTFPKGK